LREDDLQGSLVDLGLATHVVLAAHVEQS
jgi:hypothetical protein